MRAGSSQLRTASRNGSFRSAFVPPNATRLVAIGRENGMAKTIQAAADGNPAQLGNAIVLRGEGGETHQVAGGDVPVLTTQQGVPVADDQNSLRIGRRGPTALEDFHFREKLFHFDHERIPERVVHARGYGAHGYFENYGSDSAALPLACPRRECADNGRQPARSIVAAANASRGPIAS
jgi:hypothetical protein